jgi:hypothetical protein
MRWLIAFLLGCVACQGQDGAPQKDPVGPCSVEGLVLNAATGEPLKGVELTLMGGGTDEQPAPVSTTSDENGAYHFSGVAPGRYLLVARRSGFTNSYGPDGALTSNSMFVLAPSDKSRNIVVRLAPYSNIGGRIRDDAGNPAAGAFVMAYRVGASRTGKRLFQAGRDVAGAEGTYRLAGLPPGKYYIIAVARGGLGSRGGTGVTYYPGTVHFETAVALDLATGADLPNIDLRLAKAGTVCVKIRPEAPRDGLRLSLTARHSIAPEWSYAASPIGKDGHFEACGLLPGDYSAVASDDRGYSSRQPIHVDETSDQVVRLPMPPQTDFTGRIVFEGEQPRGPKGRVELRLVEWNGPPQQAEIDATGRFSFKDVNPGRYVIALAGLPQGFYVCRIRAGETDVLGKAVELAGIPPGALEIALSPNVGGVTGAVNDSKGEKPGAGAIIVLLPEEPERRDLEMFFGVALADKSGAFSIANLAPGRYRAVALDVLAEPGSGINPEFRQALRAKGDLVEVHEKSASRANLKITPASEFQ